MDMERKKNIKKLLTEEERSLLRDALQYRLLDIHESLKSTKNDMGLLLDYRLHLKLMISKINKLRVLLL